MNIFPGMGHEHFWTSGTDQAEEGKFFWMSTGKPVTYENRNAGEPTMHLCHYPNCGKVYKVLSLSPTNPYS